MIIVDLLEQRVHSYMCETGANNPEWTVEWAEPDESRHA